MTGHNKRTDQEVHQTILDIRRLKEQSKSDREIMEILGIQPRQYHRYAARIHKEDKTIWYSVTSKQLESELIKLKESFEFTYRYAMKMINDEKIDDYTKIDWLHEKDTARTNIVRLLTDSPELIMNVRGYLPSLDTN